MLVLDFGVHQAHWNWGS